MDRNRSLLRFVLVSLALLFLIANLLSPTIEYSLIFLVINQALLGVGGFLGSPNRVFRYPTMKSFFQGILWGLMIFVVNSIVGSITITIASFFLENEQIRKMISQDQAGVVSLLKTGNPPIILIMGFLLIFGAPLSEELFFRGFLISSWKENVGTIRAIFLSALLFSILHSLIQHN